MSAAERFIAGKGHLNGVLAVVPCFDAPARMAAWIQRAAHAIEDERRAVREGDACMFEPPARIHDDVLAEARALERAQEPRRQALRAALARGAGIAEILDAPVATETETWLREIWARQPARATPHPPSALRRAWWTAGLAFGASATVAVLAVLTVHGLISSHPGESAALAESGNVRARPEPARHSAPIVMTNEAPPAKMDALAIAPSRAEAGAHDAPASPAPSYNIAERRPSSPMTARLMQEIAEPDEKTDASRRAAQRRELASSPPESARTDSSEDADLVAAQKLASLSPLSVPASAPRAPSTAAAIANPPSPAMPVAPAPAYLWPVDSEQWQQLAAALARNKPPPVSSRLGASPRRQWRLLVRAPDTPEVHALVELLRGSLPPDAELSVQPDPGIPAGSANLVPPR
ncbi:MAG: hypothetical protein LBP86_03230 [Azoarcus sp.]|jgi:hypothetical protein|nr:hypothetical protein [Azoarcus sp.]